MDDKERSEGAAFHTAMVHLYRGEMNRMTVWRQRLDTTSNWAMILSVGLTTFALGSPDVPHYTLLLGLALLAVSMVIEARRYRHLHHSKWRLYLLEFGYFAEVLDPRGKADVDWRGELARELRYPRFPLTWFSAICVRLRRNYLLLVYFITAAWLTKLFVHPASPRQAVEFYQRLAVGDLIPSWFVAASAAAFVMLATTLAARCPMLETLEDWSAEYQASER